ncbi:CehA/McbA family metallohydrolase [Georgenia halophila]|uniref:CehA/McbA family metallohydrolase n=1 Tax=Georgenia halophila TaxID=620889 RepID=UPI0031EECB8C
MTRLVRALRFGLDDLLAEDLRTVPFEVDGEQSVEVTLEYDRERAVVDLGCAGPDGWRGWSGGAREGFVIRPAAATPGYVPGPLEPGEWHVQLGLYRLPVEPIEVRVTIETPATSQVPPEPAGRRQPATPRASARALPAPDGLTWFAGDFHAHSTHSDGEQSLGELAALAVRNGLDFLAVTEHNTVSHHPLLADVGAAHDITLLPGQEVTTSRGHANAFGDIGWIDFREHPDRFVSEVADRGGVLSVCHPLQEEWAWQHPLATLPRAIELWHVTWLRESTATAPWTLLSRWRDDAILLGGSDYHHPRHGYLPGTPVTWVAAEDRSPDALLDGLHAGRTAITRLPSPDAPALVRIGDDLVALAAAGTVLGDMEGRRRLLHGDRVVLPAERAGTGPFRLESPGGEILAVSP